MNYDSNSENANELLKATEVNGQAVLLERRPGDPVPEGYVQVNRAWRRMKAKQAKVAARKNRHRIVQGDRPTKGNRRTYY
jgi:hypothetical protein